MTRLVAHAAPSAPERRRSWRVATAALLAVLATVTFWSALLHARSTPHYSQTAPGAWARPTPDGMPLRLVQLTRTPVLVTDREQNPAPAGATYVVALLEFDSAGVEFPSCILHLLATDGRRWRPQSGLDYEGSRVLPDGCSAGSRAELVFLIPDDAAPVLAGLVAGSTANRSLDAYPVLTPPAG